MRALSVQEAVPTRMSPMATHRSVASIMRPARKWDRAPADPPGVERGRHRIRKKSYAQAIALPILAGMPEPQHVDGRFLNLVAHLVVPDEQPPDLTRLELEELFADARIGQQDGWGLGQRLHRPCSSRLV